MLLAFCKTIAATSAVVFSHLLLAASPPTAPPTTPLSDPRLLGHWLSDIDRTAFLRRYELAQEDETLEKFEDTYSNLHKLITKTHITLWRADKPNDKYTGRYRVIARDTRSVIIETHEPKGGRKLIQVFFDDKGHYILGGHRVEFFKRLIIKTP